MICQICSVLSNIFNAMSSMKPLVKSVRVKVFEKTCHKTK